MTAFDQLGLSENALGAVKRMGFERATPVQEQAIPLVLEGRDIIAAAQTGTGKTAAFALPAMDVLDHAKAGSGPLMLVVTPTRELAQQIGEVAEQVALSTRHRITTVVGGLSYKPQIEKLRRGTDILIATPGRLIDLMGQKAVRLDDVRVLVLDEADRMLDMGFLPSVKQIVAATPTSRQTLLFSATIDKSIMSVVGSMLHDPATVEIARKGTVAETIDQFVINTPQSVKPALIKAVLAEKGAERVIVFARTRSRADSTCRRLRKAGYAVEAIHSDRSQNQRRRALQKFAAGEVNIITATDVLARGIDVEQVDYVINYDVPEQAEDYIHRIGRTGRAGQAGFAITFVTPENKKEMRDIEKLLKKTVPEMKLDDFDMAEAEAASAEAAIAAQSKRDPEVNRVKRDLANKAQKRAEELAESKAQGESAPQSKSGKRKRQKAAAPAKRQKAASPAKRQSGQPKRKAAQAPVAASAPKTPRAKSGAQAKDVREKAPATSQKAPRQKSGAAPSKAVHAKPSRSSKPRRANAAGSRPEKAAGDFRPGRARRAEVKRARTRKGR